MGKRRGMILLTNVYNFHNIGEVSQVKALVQELPQYRFLVSGLYTYADPGRLDEVGLGSVMIVGHKLKHTRPAVILTSVRLLVEAVLVRLSGMLPVVKFAPLHPILQAYCDPLVELVVDLSGDTFSDDASPAYTIIHSVSLLLAVIVGKPYVLCSQTLGPFHYRLTRRLAKFLIDRAAAVTLRGTLSWAHLKHEVGVNNKLQPVTDLAFLLDAPDMGYIRQCREQGVMRHSRPHIGINPSRIISQWMFPEEDSPAAKERAYERLMARLVDYLAQENVVVLIPHTTGPENGLGTVTNPDDRESIRGVLEMHDPRCDWEAYLGEDVGTIMQRIAECDLFIGCRYHSCIEAVTAGVPTIAMAYSTKGRDLGLSADSPLLEVVDVRGKSAERLLIELGEAISRMRSRLPQQNGGAAARKMRVNAMKSIDVIKEVIMDLHTRLLGDYGACYVGRATDHATRHRAASGGVATALLRQAMSDGLVDRAVVARGDERQLQPWPTVADQEQLLDSQGSVYPQTAATPSDIANMCWSHAKGGEARRFAVVGLPCQIRALRSLEERSEALRSAVGLHIGLFCSHAVEREGIDLLLEAMGIDPVTIEKVQYRGKSPSTGRTGLYIKTTAGEHFVPLSQYWSKYLNFLFIPRKCWACKDLANERADISLGDAWRLQEHSNVVVVRTPIGEEVLRSAVLSGTVEVTQIPAEAVVKGQKFFLALKKNGSGPITSTYKVVRRIGHEVTVRQSLHPLVKLWVKKVVLK